MALRRSSASRATKGGRTPAPRLGRWAHEQPAPDTHPRRRRLLLDLGDGENRIDDAFVVALEDALDAAEAAAGPRALVTTARGKHWSLGLDLRWLLVNGDVVPEFVARWQRAYARLLVAPFPTVAAIQGHAFAGGAMLWLAHDMRVMRSDRGFWCLPEIDGALVFPPGLSALITRRLAPQVAHEAMLTARRYGGDDAEAAGIVDRTGPADAILPEALAIAREQAPRAGTTFGAIKRAIYADTYAALDAGETAPEQDPAAVLVR